VRLLGMLSLIGIMLASPLNKIEKIPGFTFQNQALL